MTDKECPAAATEESRWSDAVDKALVAGPRLIRGKDELNAAATHVFGLLRDSAHLLQSGSAPTAAFLAITAIEEVAKIHLGIHRTGEAAAKRRDDPFYSHRLKHLLACAPTIEMGSRLQAALGPGPMKELLTQGRSGGFVDLRERCLYLVRTDVGLQTPGDVVPVTMARGLLLLALEVFEDALVGLTNRSYELGNDAARLFATIAASPTTALGAPDHVGDL